MVKIKDLYKTNEESRYKALQAFFEKNDIESSYGPLNFFSTSGRCELGGNHTDHNKGKTLACSINLDTIACVRKTNDNNIYLISEGFDKVQVNLNDLNYNSKEKGTTVSLLKGICNRFKELNANIEGFIAVTTTKVFKGSGLSSSAAIEVLCCTIINSLFNNDKFSTTDLALISQYSENSYFGKPSGLLDQLSCANKAISFTDFKGEVPIIKTLDVDFETYGYSIIITILKSDHSNLTHCYTDIVKELKEVSKFFNKDFLREVDSQTFYDNLPKLRKYLKNDRALTRSIHFYNENIRVEKMVKALELDDIKTYLELVNESGNSSSLLLQNIYYDYKTQDLTLALGLAKSFLQDKGATRVHGGGFAGTIISYVPLDEKDNFINFMNKSLGYNSCIEINVRQYSTCKVLI